MGHYKLPKRIILVRHGESQGNIDTKAYSVTPDHSIPLTSDGINQAREAGNSIRRLLDTSSFSADAAAAWRVYFYVSPYERTRSTLREIGRSFPRRRVIGVREECRIREQDFGNFQVEERMMAIKQTREKFGRFFYRFPEGESAADVYDRISSFMESLWRDIDMHRLQHDPDHELNLVIVTHGLLSRVFLMKWFKWTVEQFEYLNNPGNCEYRVMELGEGGEYSLAINHTEEELLEWGLSPEMVADQKWRAHAKRGEWNEKCTWYLDSFFDHLEDSDHSADDDSSPYSGKDGQLGGLKESCNNHVEGEEHKPINC
ncbi:phosphoglycerate mutase-like protein AT74H [Chenopodium quinoa]|uniref:phosphoglycerate mutase-like protein AT74H n=1 Tax=Chenopodium quinoa TaxID=63459 RepID=UPI000B799C18|nr:phosphoglycerate mutase-like protein AT74H [Chenopodium quinoa]